MAARSSFVQRVALRDFRTYTRAEAQLGEGLTVVHGPNGAGKSNLLEAIYFGCTARSPRTRNDRELVRFGARTARVVVTVVDAGEAHELAVGFGANEDGGSPVKRMTLDGSPVERLVDVAVRPLVSVFMPDRLELVKGPPAVRRAHLDQFVAALSPLGGEARREYGHVLAQRNALLSRVARGQVSSEALATWDAELARRALVLMEHRLGAVRLLADPFAARARELGLGEEARLEYRPRSKAADVDGFRAELGERLGADLDRGFTVHGPHRDELALIREARELRVFGSQGEQRTALLALLLAERDVLGEERGRLPLLLLDDVMSELDAERRELLAGELAASGQSVIATTDLSHVPGASAAHVSRLRVSPGTILQEARAA
jgi:DNA replication and repair protein RecF